MSEVPLTSVAHNATLAGDGTTAAPLSVVVPASAGMSAAIPAAPDEMIVLITVGANVGIADTPLLAWLADETGDGTASLPVTLDTLTAQWAHVVITQHGSPPELIGGGPAGPIEVYLSSDPEWRGNFVDFLDWLETSTGLAVVGTQLMSDPLKGAYLAWVSRRHGGRRFAAAP